MKRELSKFYLLGVLLWNWSWYRSFKRYTKEFSKIPVKLIQYTLDLFHNQENNGKWQTMNIRRYNRRNLLAIFIKCKFNIFQTIFFYSEYQDTTNKMISTIFGRYPKRILMETSIVFWYGKLTLILKQYPLSLVPE